MKVEIRWKDQLSTGRDPFHAYLKHVPKTNTPTAMETAFQLWLQDKVWGQKLLVSDIEFYVDDKMIELEREEENRFFRRMEEASNK